MEKLGLGCAFSFLVGKQQESITGPSLLQLNYDCYLQIFSHLNALEDQLNLGRAHPLFQDVLADVLRTRYGKINVRMLKTVSDWEFLLSLCGSEVVRCEVPHGRWDEAITYPFLDVISRYCPNLRQLVVIFMHADTETPPVGGDRGHIMQQFLKLPSLSNLTLIDARTPQLEQLHNFGKLQALDVDGLDPNLSVSAFRQIFENKLELKRLLLNFGRRFRLVHQMPELAECLPLLEHLTLENFDCDISDLGDLRALQSLRLINRWLAEVNTDFYRSLLKRYCDRLLRLQLISIRVREDQVPRIVSLRQLKALDCDNWPAKSMAEVSKLTDLECLALDCKEESPVNASEQLLAVVTSCLMLKHIKFGKRWQMSGIDVNDFVANVREIISKREQELLMTFIFIKTHSRREEIQHLLKDQSLLRVSFNELSTCPHCEPDTHSRFDTIFD
ncbi:uncharacterized protein LOC110179039 [Drosophila serrata]|uniref:uncharacterized protein LOC110179039 n=1 Tax=Drosophila serrata TaxID=7274 RepID=UPI000A1D3809|nr:uncharacterized protein LOC110179039 [Drosophila serrata]XP_020802054.1 uncharacterized protein LOC110179039 [Drosophila serrata]